MTTKQFSEAFKIAQSDKDLNDADISNLLGYGLPGFKPVHTTLRSVAREIRWNALRFNGTWDMSAVNETAYHAKKSFLII
jgi:hypothetical protein